MRASLFTLAGFLPFVWGQQTLYPNATYKDALSLISNQTSLTALWAALQQYIEIASTFAHYTNVTIIAPNNNAVLGFRNSKSEFAQPNNRTTLSAVFEYHLLLGQYVNPAGLTFGQTLLAPSTFTNVTGGQVVGVGQQNGVMTFMSGQGQKATAVADPIYFQGGVVHVVDQVLTIPSDLSTTTGFLNLTSTSGAFNLTGLTTSLTSTWDVTIFAPANSGFAAIASEAANMTVADVTRLMKYHMLLGTALYSSEFNNTEYTTIQGGSVTLSSRSDGSTYVNNARIIQSDILLANGVLHIIDNVLNPDNTATAPTGTTSGIVAFAGAQANGTTPFTNVPIPNSASGSPNLNSTIPSASATPTGKSGPSLSAGIIAAVVLGGIIGVAILVGGIWFCFRMRGYRLKVSRRSILISSPRLIQDSQYELPQDGGKTDKVELPASVPSAYYNHRQPDYGNSDTSTVKSDTAALLEKPPAPPAKDNVKKKKESPISPVTPAAANLFELSADQDVRARIERLMRPRR